VKRGYWIFALAPLLAACGSSGPPPPVVETASQPVAPNDMPALCRGEASAQYGVKPENVSTAAVTRIAGGGYSIRGEAEDLVGKKTFQCSFDTTGRFKGVASASNEAKS
jgi:hypothetical protein